jgi:hypothetical protein
MALILPIAFAVIFLIGQDEGWRERIVRAAVLVGAIVVLLTEGLGAIGALQRQALFWSWVFVILLSLWIGRRSLHLPNNALDWRISNWVDAALVASIGAILGIVGFTALISPPNSADAMAYHLPRVVYWIQQRSVAFFPTPYLNQIMLSPVAEYFSLHTMLLSGTDRFVNLIQWFGCATSTVAVSLIAKEFGANARGQILAALFCATLPNGILQASGAKNDYLLAAWLASMVWFYLRARSRLDVVFGALALGLALGTKATAFLFAPAFLLIALLLKWKFGWKPILQAAGVAVAALVLIDGPQFARNIDLSGSPLGFDSAQGDGVYRWRNESFRIRNTASNLLRHLSEQLGGRSEEWNQGVYAAVVRMHHLLGVDPNSEETTFRSSMYRPPRRANHEADAPNTWHLAALILCGPFLFKWRRLEGMPRLIEYGAAIVLACLLFCFCLKWQPFMSRMWLPLFVLGAPITGFVAGRIRQTPIQLVLVLFFLSGARLPLFQNWTRRLTGPDSLLRTERAANYFNDLSQFDNRDSYLKTAELLAGSTCERIGIDANLLQVEYPLQALLRDRRPGVVFVHTGITNASRKYQNGNPEPCAVVCLNCAGVEEKRAEYRSAGEEHQAGSFLVFLSR